LHQPLKPLANAIAASALMAFLCVGTLGAESSRNPDARGVSEPTVWQGPELTAQLVPPAPSASVTPHATPPDGMSQSAATSGDTSTPSAGSPAPTTASPLLNGNLPTDELMPPVVNEGCGEQGGHQGVQPYGGGHPTDWSWGCNGSPFRNGPGLCDDWIVGPRWHVTVDGMVMHREATDLAAILNQMPGSIPIGSPDDGIVGDPSFEQFDHAPGARITFTSQVARCTGYDVQAVYEGINNWNASIVFPKQALTVVPNGSTNAPPTQFVIQPDPNTEPPSPFPEGFLQRSLYYRSNFNSGELNFLTNCDPEWRPFFGVRFIRFDDEIRDYLNQEAQPPLPGPETGDSGGPTPENVNDPIGPTSETDRLNLFHLQNNLMGFQIGLLHDTIDLNERFALEGFVSGGVYYNKVKYSNVMGVFTTQTFADNTRSTDVIDARTDQSNVVNNDARTLSEISYEAEASLTAVCRLNRCWALRAGYQVLWINHLHLADAAYLGDPEADSDLLFHGWHAGIECRR
jgi:hypothetical protein